MGAGWFGQKIFADNVIRITGCVHFFFKARKVENFSLNRDESLLGWAVAGQGARWSLKTFRSSVRVGASSISSVCLEAVDGRSFISLFGSRCNPAPYRGASGFRGDGLEQFDHRLGVGWRREH
jgi:hypothetical protein